MIEESEKGARGPSVPMVELRFTTTLRMARADLFAEVRAHANGHAPLPDAPAEWDAGDVMWVSRRWWCETSCEFAGYGDGEEAA